MNTLTSRERFQRMFEHRDADRVPIQDSLRAIPSRLLKRPANTKSIRPPGVRR